MSIQLVTPPLNIQAVMEIIAQSTINISILMTQALAGGLSEKLSFKQLAERHIKTNLEQDIQASDAKTQRVYKKIFEASTEFIQNKSPMLVNVLSAINADTNDANAGAKFFGSFVFEETKKAVVKLENEHPEALENPTIWL